MPKTFVINARRIALLEDEFIVEASSQEEALSFFKNHQRELMFKSQRIIKPFFIDEKYTVRDVYELVDGIDD